MKRDEVLAALKELHLDEYDESIIESYVDTQDWEQFEDINDLDEDFYEYAENLIESEGDDEEEEGDEE